MRNDRIEAIFYEQETLCKINQMSWDEQLIS